MYANNLEKSEEAYNKAYKLFAGKINERNPVAAESLNGLASVALTRQENDKALDLYRQALTSAKHPFSTAFRPQYDPRPRASLESGIQNSIGILYMSLTNYSEARKWFKEAEEGIEKTYGKNAAELEPILKNLAHSYKMEKKLGEAQEILVRCLLIEKKARGGMLSFQDTSRKLASILWEAGDAEIEALFGKLLATDPKVFHPEDFHASAAIMARYFSLTNWPRTVQLMEKTIELSEKKFGAQNKWLLPFLESASELAVQHEHFEDSERYLFKLIASVEHNDGPASIALVEPYKLLARQYTQQKLFDKAEKFHDKQIALLETAFGKDDSRVAEALEAKAAFYEKSGNAEQAVKVRADANQRLTAGYLKKN